MTKGQFAALTAALGLATMAGTGYIAYAGSTSNHSGGAGASSTPGTDANQGGGQASQGSGNGGDGGTAAQTPGAVADPSAPRCVNADIIVSTTDNEGAAGHISLLLVFTNTGDRACALDGYPGASLQAKDGTDLLDAKRTLYGYSGGAVGLTSTPRVVLPPKGKASAVLEWSDVTTGSGGNGDCAVTDAAALAVTPPNTTRTTTITLSGQVEVCAEFQVHPVLHGVVRTP